jgi:alpha-galactosidase
MKLLGIGAAIVGVASANDNGLGLKPPLGWRSWNLYGANVNQSLIQAIMKGMTVKVAPPDGETGPAASLCDLGYCDVGLDDNWQACGSPQAAPGMKYHDAQGNPIVNLNRFPDFKAMTSYAHSMNLTSGWYGNNCICSDHCKGTDECEMQMKQDVAALIKYDFDAWKLDGCGGETDLATINKYIKAAGKPIMVENCHWGSKYPFKPDKTVPPEEGCPWNFYRSSGDVRASYGSILHNLGTVYHLESANLSYPGCWAYPDMLQVGCSHGPGGKNDPGLTAEETRTHFGAWAIVSSPLTLSHDVNDAAMTAKIWPVISNKEALAVSQAYVGESGTMFKQSSEMLSFTDAYIEATEGEEPIDAPAFQYLYKPLEAGGAKTAVLLMNSGDDAASLTVNFGDIPGVKCTKCDVRDIWAHKDLGSFTTSYTATSVASHDAAFYVITPSAEDPAEI